VLGKRSKPNGAAKRLNAQEAQALKRVLKQRTNFQIQNTLHPAHQTKDDESTTSKQYEDQRHTHAKGVGLLAKQDIPRWHQNRFRAPPLMSIGRGLELTKSGRCIPSACL